MALAFTPAVFFEQWLPQAFAAQAQAAQRAADVSLLVEIDGNTWTLQLQQGQLHVHPGNTSPAVFRLRLNATAFEHLVLPTTQHGAAQPLPWSRLDAETLRMASAIPGCFQLYAEHAGGNAEVTFGPSNADFEQAACTARCQLQDLERVRSGQQNPMDLFMSGKLTLEGNLEVALALGGLLLG